MTLSFAIQQVKNEIQDVVSEQAKLVIAQSDMDIQLKTLDKRRDHLEAKLQELQEFSDEHYAI